MHYFWLCPISLQYLYSNTRQNKYTPRNMTKPKHKDNLKAIVVEKVAEKHAVTKDYVYKVVAGTREDEDIFRDFMNGTEVLVNAVKDLVPFP